jgi:hypothetical protein
VSKAAALADGAKAFNVRWLAESTASPRFLRLSLYDNAKPSSTVARMYSSLSRPQSSVLTQLCTTHVLLNAYLYCFHLGPSPDCALCLVPETVPHFLLLCPQYRRQRLDLIRRLGTARLSLRLLLAVKSDPKPVLEFARDIGCFPRYAI